jgi:hypothetical protein
MENLEGSVEHKIRQKGIGDRVAWGEWCYEELEKERPGRREGKLEGGENVVC